MLPRVVRLALARMPVHQVRLIESQDCELGRFPHKEVSVRRFTNENQGWRKRVPADLPLAAERIVSG